MQSRIEGGPSFSHIHVDLEPGEVVRAEADAIVAWTRTWI